MCDIINLNDILSNISNEYNIPIGDLMKYTEKKTKKKTILCKARKQDGLQCTRRSKCNSPFCGKHIDKRNYGCVSEDTHIECKVIEHNEKMYFVDDFGIVYEKNSINTEKYSIVGTRKTNTFSFI